MKFIKPKGVLAGFHVQNPNPALPELEHIGEQWTPSDYLIGWHNHPFWEAYLQVEGESHWRCGKQLQTVGTGWLLAVPPNRQHRLEKASSTHHFMFVGIRDPAIRRVFEMLGAAPPADLACTPAGSDLLDALRRMSREVTLQRPHALEGLRLTLDLFLLEWARSLAGGDSRPHRELAIPSSLFRCREMVLASPSEQWSLDSLGRIAGQSPKHLSEQFKRHFGVGFRKFLLQARIKEAKTLLRTTDAPVTDIALDLGFSSSQTFARAFKSETGTTPSAWRGR